MFMSSKIIDINLYKIDKWNLILLLNLFSNIITVYTYVLCDPIP